MKVAPMGIAVFICGALSAYKFNVIGEVYAAEIMLLPMAVAALFSRNIDALFKEKIFLILIFSLILMVAGYIISDLARDGVQGQYLRGWGRVALLISDFFALAVLVAYERRIFWWFVLGSGLGAIIFLLDAHTPLREWKLGYGIPVVLSVIAVGRYFSARLNSAILVALAFINIWFDFRMLGTICLMVAAISWARAGNPGAALRGTGLLNIMLPALFLGAALLIGLMLTQDDYRSRREQSNVGRTVGIKVGLTAITESPLLGYGSWSDNKELSKLYRAEMTKSGVNHGEAAGVKGFSPHSQVLQAWMEGGALGVVFFIVYGFMLFREVKFVALTRKLDSYTSMFLFFLLMGIWDLLMSPFAGIHRMYIAVAAAILTIIAMEKKTYER
ncbi:MAG: hypothetical protein AABY83_10815 [Pseudomonadota bacterium]